MPRQSYLCPICGKGYAALSQHLQRGHQIKNVHERSILIKLSSGHINVRQEPCPILGCTYKGGRCDRHILTQHLEMTLDQRKTELAMLKTRTGLDLLRSLRRNHPVPCMASFLDVQPEAEEGVDVVLRDPEPQLDCPGCQQAHQKSNQLQQENHMLRSELGKLRASFGSLTKRCNRMATKQGVVS